MANWEIVTWLKSLLLIFFLLPISCAHQGHLSRDEGSAAAVALPVSDGFEQETLSAIWRRTRILSADFRFQSQFARMGKHAIEIALHEGDHAEQSPGNNPTERAELLETRSLESIEGQAYSYSFSIYLPRASAIRNSARISSKWACIGIE